MFLVIWKCSWVKKKIDKPKHYSLTKGLISPLAMEYQQAYRSKWSIQTVFNRKKIIWGVGHRRNNIYFCNQRNRLGQCKVHSRILFVLIGSALLWTWLGASHNWSIMKLETTKFTGFTQFIDTYFIVLHLKQVFCELSLAILWVWVEKECRLCRRYIRLR